MPVGSPIPSSLSVNCCAVIPQCRGVIGHADGQTRCLHREHSLHSDTCPIVSNRNLNGADFTMRFDRIDRTQQVLNDMCVIFLGYHCGASHAPQRPSPRALSGLSPWSSRVWKHQSRD